MMRSRPARGFTLVEVLVALFIMAVLAGMAWQGIDAMVRTRDGARAASESMLRLGTVLAQWEQDLSNLQDTAAAPALRFDGVAMRLTRRSPDGMHFVVWTRQGKQLWRWMSPPVTRVQDLQDWWIRSQQWTAISADALAMLDDLGEWQVYFWRGQDNNWSNAQSSGDQPITTPPPPPPAPGGSAPGGGGGGGGESGGGGNGAPPEFEREALPKGVRLQLALPAGQLTRDLMLRP